MFHELIDVIYCKCRDIFGYCWDSGILVDDINVLIFATSCKGSEEIILSSLDGSEIA